MNLQCVILFGRLCLMFNWLEVIVMCDLLVNMICVFGFCVSVCRLIILLLQLRLVILFFRLDGKCCRKKCVLIFSLLWVKMLVWLWMVYGVLFSFQLQVCGVLVSLGVVKMQWIRCVFFYVSEVVVVLRIFLNSVSVELCILWVFVVVMMWVFGVIILCRVCSCCFSSVSCFGILISISVGVVGSGFRLF